MVKSAIGSRLLWRGLQLLGVPAAAMLGAVGCSATAAPGEDVGSGSQAYDPSVFYGWSSQPPTNSGGFTDSPGACRIGAKLLSGGGFDGIMLLGRHGAGTSVNRFRFALYYKQRGWLSWPDLGTQTFNSKPACSMLNDVYSTLGDSNWTSRVAILGKGTDNRYYARIMAPSAAGQVTDPPPSPTFPVDWHSISTTTYDSAPFVTAEFGYLIVGGRTSNGTINIHLNKLTSDPFAGTRSYDKTAWRAPIALPALPTGWTPVGDPAVASEGSGGLIDVVTRAKNAFNQTRLYINYLYIPFAGDNGYFLGPPQWAQVSTGTIPVSSDPALEYDVSRGELTLYFRGGSGTSANRIFQSTTQGVDAWGPFGALGTDTFATAPAAAGSLQFDWSHVVTARKSDTTQTWWNGIDPRVFGQ